jgi:hypothetical protein
MNYPEKFKDNNYFFVPELLDKHLVKFLASYYQAAKDGHVGFFDLDPTSLNCNGDAVADAVLYLMRDKLEKLTGLELLPSYSFVRIYRQGEKVGKHTDGPENQISCTMCVSRDEVDWPLFVSFKGVEDSFVMQPGDGVIYRGYEVNHWRDKFSGENQVQVIIGLVEKGSEFEDKKYYGRPEPMFAPVGNTRPGAVKYSKGVMYRFFRDLKHRFYGW